MKMHACKKNIKRNATLVVCFVMFVSILAVGPHMSYAQTSNDYQLLAPIPIGGGSGSVNSVSTNNFSDYAQNIISFLIGFAAVLAVLMIMFGGFTYMTSEALGGKESGKEMMLNAVYGLLLILASFLILQTINPELLNLNLNIGSITGTVPAGGGGGGGTQAPPPSNATPNFTPGPGQLSNSIALDQLRPSGFGVSSTGNCSNRNISTCTSLDGLQETTAAGLQQLAEGCSNSNSRQTCSLIISGGTETGHAGGAYSHASGYKADISYNSGSINALNQYLSGIGVNTTATDGFQAKTVGDYTYVFHPEPTNNHWDIKVCPSGDTACVGSNPGD